MAYIVCFCPHWLPSELKVSECLCSQSRFGKWKYWQGEKGQKETIALEMRPILSGVAKTSRMLGHSKGMLRLHELLCKVQKHLGTLGHTPPENLQNFIASQVDSEAIL